jgi:hypothetical protein
LSHHGLPSSREQPPFAQNATYRVSLQFKSAAAEMLGPSGAAMRRGMSREAFELIGGFAEDYGNAHGDWELYTRAAVLGLRIEAIPLPLFWYRVGSDSMMRQRECEAADLLRNIRAYAGNLPPEIYRIVQLAQGLEHRLWKPCEPTHERGRLRHLDAS